MKKIFCFMVCCILFLFASTAFASFEVVNCEKFYKFQSGVAFEGFITEKTRYAPGEEVLSLYSLKSVMDAPIVEGSVLAQIMYEDEKDGEQLIDEFFVSRKINLRVNDSISQRLSWKIPVNAKDGKYTLKTYFIVGDFFNLMGLSILPYGPPGVPGAQTFFTVSNQNNLSRIYFSKADTYLNDKKYEFAMPVDLVLKQPAKIRTKLVNEGPAKAVEVSFRTYVWADVSGEAIKESVVEETVQLAAGTSRDFEYVLPNIPTGAYEVVFEARSGEEKSMMKLRLPVPGKKGRFIYLCLDSFPLKKDANASVFVCYSNSADYASLFNGSMKVKILDSKGNKVFEGDSGILPIYPTPPQGLGTSFIVPADLTDLTLEGEFYGSDGILHDSVGLRYDYSKFQKAESTIKLSLAKDELVLGEKLPYKVEVAGEKGIKIGADVSLYLMDWENNVLDVSEKRVEGALEEEMPVVAGGGSYHLVAMLPEKNQKAEAAFIIKEETTTTTAQETTTTTRVEATTTTTPSRINMADIYPFAVAALIIILILYFLSGRRGKK